MSKNLLTNTERVAKGALINLTIRSTICRFVDPRFSVFTIQIEMSQYHPMRSVCKP